VKALRLPGSLDQPVLHHVIPRRDRDEVRTLLLCLGISDLLEQGRLLFGWMAGTEPLLRASSIFHDRAGTDDGGLVTLSFRGSKKATTCPFWRFCQKAMTAMSKAIASSSVSRLKKQV